MKKCAAWLVFAWVPGAYAGEIPEIHPTLSAAVTAGQWNADDSSGEYRILVFTGGFEHVSSWVVAQLIALPSSNDSEAKVVRSVELVGPGFLSLGEPHLTQHENHLRVELNGRRTHSPEQEVSCVFDLLPNGEIRTTKPCG